ncbi:PREDICTED: uncharacterized protein LOC105556569, partial [Vollenhovia emeryi]|uniref:uncharacterized protein LOC105556569 n=1 Tax=Vollenhovia emeryi TaxID=411798 RepID=UPI0005F41E59
MTSNMSVINETDSESLTPAEVVETAKTAIENLLPEKSKEKYTTAYNKFMDWRTKNKVKSFSENTLLTYFTEMSHNHKPTTLWANYSMLKTTLSINNDINIHNYKKLTAFLKRKSQGFQSKKSQVLTPEQIQIFLNEAPDDTYLDTKVAMIFGICGACRREELTQITINDIEDKGSILLVKIPKTKNYKPRSFVITDEFYSIFKKYITLRPKDVENSRFFLNYQNGRCTRQPIGLNKFVKIPRIIASYLKLPDPQSYTGHTFRRTSATLLADSGADIITLKRHGGWKSNTVAEGYIEDSFNNKKKICNQITCSILNKPTTCTSQESEININNPSTSNEVLPETKNVSVNLRKTHVYEIRD